MQFKQLQEALSLKKGIPNKEKQRKNDLIETDDYLIMLLDEPISIRFSNNYQVNDASINEFLTYDKLPQPSIDRIINFLNLNYSYFIELDIYNDNRLNTIIQQIYDIGDYNHFGYSGWNICNNTLDYNLLNTASYKYVDFSKHFYTTINSINTFVFQPTLHASVDIYEIQENIINNQSTYNIIKSSNQLHNIFTIGALFVNK